MKSIVNLATHYKDAPSDQSIFIFEGDYSRLHLKVLKKGDPDYRIFYKGNGELSQESIYNDRLGNTARSASPIQLQTDTHYCLVFCEYFTYEPCSF